MTLHELGEHHGTDQATVHDYLRRLEPFFAPFRDQAINLLEIGVAEGNSIRTWHDYFLNGTIVGVDKNPTCWMPTLNFPKLRIVNGDAGSVQFWREFELVSTNWSIVIDDGSHKANDVVCAFEMLWPRVSKGGLYIIEDVHACWLPDSYGDFMSHFTNKLPRMNWADNRIAKQNVAHDDIDFMHFTKGLIIVGKL